MKVAQSSNRVEETAGWQSLVAGLSLSVVGAVIGSSLGRISGWPIDAWARIANGMDPLPIPFKQAVRAALRIHDDWWLLMLIGIAVGVTYVVASSRSPAKLLKAFVVCFALVFIARFLLQGHLPLNGFVGYGVEHYAIRKLGFFIENLLICGFAWVATHFGCRIMLGKRT